MQPQPQPQPASGSLAARHARIRAALKRPHDARMEQFRHDRIAFARAGGFTPDRWQEQVLASNAPKLLLNVTRQGGKSSTSATLGMHTALFEDNSLILMVSPTQRQSGELFRKALTMYRALGRPLDAEAETALTLELENGSRIVALPGKEGSIRSYSGVRLLLLDEASRIPNDTYMSVRPMLAVSQGRIVAMSTPFGTRGWWYEAWRSTTEAWERYEVPASACPRITPEFLAEERASMGEWWFQQEYGCAFLDAESSAFRSEDIAAALDPGVEQWAL